MAMDDNYCLLITPGLKILGYIPQFRRLIFAVYCHNKIKG